MAEPRAFDDIPSNPTPCPICLQLALDSIIQPRAVMPLPNFPALNIDGVKCCRDCQATETMMRLGFQHPEFGAARLTVANERCEGLTMPLGMMEHFGLCKMGYIRPCSLEDLESHLRWLESHGHCSGIGLLPVPEKSSSLARRQISRNEQSDEYNS